jgi:hypothetical protein
MVAKRSNTVTHDAWYYFDVAGKGIITVSLFIMAFFGQRLIGQIDEQNKDINDLKVRVNVLETKLDYIISNMEYRNNTANYNSGK